MVIFLVVLLIACAISYEVGHARGYNEGSEEGDGVKKYWEKRFEETESALNGLLGDFNKLRGLYSKLKDEHDELNKSYQALLPYSKPTEEKKVAKTQKRGRPKKS